MNSDQRIKNAKNSAISAILADIDKIHLDRLKQLNEKSAFRNYIPIRVVRRLVEQRLEN